MSRESINLTPIACRSDAGLFCGVFAASREALVLADDAGRYVDANPAACKLFGCNREELIGRDIGEFLVSPDAPRTRPAFRPAHAQHGRGRMLRRDGQTREIQWRSIADVEPGLHMTAVHDISDAAHTERQLAASAATYRTLFDDGPQPMFVYDQETLGIIAVNQSARQHYGYSDEEFKHMDILNIRPEEERERVLHHLATADLRRRSGPWRHLKKDESIIEVEVASAPITLDGRAARLSIVTDVTERIAMERSLAETEARYRSILETANEGIGAIDGDACISIANPRLADMLGRTVQDLIGRTALDLVAPADVERAREVLERLRRGDASPFEFRLRRSDGRVLWVTARFSILQSGSREFAGALGILTDLTEHKAAARALEASEERFRRAFARSAIGMSLATLDGALTQVNDSFCTTLRYDRNELIGRRLFDFVHPDDSERVREAAARSIEAGYGTVEGRWVRKDGGVAWLRVSVSVIQDDAGEPAAFFSVADDITEKKRSAEALAQSEELFRSVVESTAEIITILGADGVIRYESPAIEPVLEYKPDELVGVSAYDLIHPDDGAAIREGVNNYLSGGSELGAVEYRVRHKDGTWRTIESLYRSLLDHPAVQGFVVASRDVTERRLVEQERLASRERLELATSAAGIGFWDFDLRAGKAESSPANHELYGFESAPANIEEWLSWAHPEDRDEARARMMRLYAGEGPFEMDFRVVRPDGTMRWIAGRASCFRDRSGLPVRVIGVNRDVTEAKLGRLELERRQHEYRSLVENLPDIVVRMDSALRIVYASPRISKLGIRDWREKRWDEAGLPPTISALFRQKAIAALRSGAERRFEFRMPDTTQATIFEARIIPEPDGGGGVSLLAIIKDITRTKHVEELLRESEERFRSAFTHAATGIAIADVEGRLISVNKAYSALTGYPESELIGRRYMDITHPDDLAAQTSATAELIAGRRTSLVLEKRYIRKDGAVVWARNSVSRQVIGDAVSLVAICEDITERKRAEADRQLLQEQLLHAQKMEAVGRLAGGIAHDFNNLLTVILGYGAMIRRKLPPDGELTADIDQVLTSAERAASLTSQLLAFSRKQMLRPRRINLNDELRAMQEMIRRLIGEDIELAIKFDPELGDVQADPGQIGQVIMNLVVNARDAMPNGGTLTIATRAAVLADQHGALRPFATVTFADTGTGMTEDVRKRIFEPFFTTKQTGKGTGLGLPMVLGIIEQSGGSVDVTSEPGAGSCFSIRLPCYAGIALAEESTPESPVRARGARILLVEDEQAVRTLAAEILTGSGYDVLTAARGASAVEIAATEAIDLLVADVVMPVMNGPEVAAAVRRLHPGVPVVFMSGYSEHPAIRRNDPQTEFASAAFVQKPFTAEKLLAAVAAALGQARSEAEAPSAVN
jgi:two-component system cell cycle sensor histidine kinase/response regulator CckA